MVNKLWFLDFIKLSFCILIVKGAVPESPTINLDPMGGQMGFIGDFVGLSPYKQVNQFETIPNNLHGFIKADTSSDSEHPIYTLFATVNGTIDTYCQLSDTRYILAGNFSAMNGTTFNHIAQLDTTTHQLTPLQQGLDAPVRSVYCTTNGSAYVGGDFIAPFAATNVSAFSGHVALWQNNQWLPVPWKGFNGPIYTILYHPQQQSILFGGQFDSTGDGKFATLNSSQSINLASSAIIGSGNSQQFGSNTDPASIICSKSPWLLQNGVPGYWEAQFGSSVSPLVFRLANTHLSDQGTNEFNIIALGSNQYFTLSYTDPVTNKMTTCSTKCILSNNTSIPYQDFTVTNKLTASAIRINIDSWYGLGGGLGGVDIFTSDVSLQPQITKNANETTGCSSSSSSSSATTTGNWTEVYSYQTYQNFLIANFPSTELSSTTTSATYSPYILSQGNYNVYVTTPGCVGTSNCNQRTQVALDITMNPGNTSTLIIDQRNTADNRSLIYSGPISSTSSSFQPKVVLHVAPNAIAPSNSVTVSMVANSMEFVRNSTEPALSSILNYYPSNNTWLPLSQQLPASSSVHTLQAKDNKIYIGGQFAVNGSFANIVAYDFAQGFQPLTNSGLNGNVTSALLMDSKLVVGGLFNSTANNNQPLNNAAIYDINTNTWSNMNNGPNDRVDHVYSSSSSSVYLSGPFTLVNGSSVYNNAQWSLTENRWIPSTSFISGPVSNQFTTSDGTFYLGTITSAQSYRANGVSLSSNNQPWNSDITMLDPNALTTSGTVWKNGNQEVVILSGLFAFNNNRYHVVMNKDGVWTGLMENVQGNVSSLYVLGNLLFIGGQFNGKVDASNTVSSLAVYDLSKNTFQTVQGLTISNQTPGQVNTIRPQADGKMMFVVGSFAFAGRLNCNSICALSVDNFQWTQLGQNMGGNIKDIAVNDTAITVVGDLMVDSTASGLAVLDNGNAASWRSLSNTNLSTIMYDGSSRYFVSGVNNNNQSYLGSWDGSNLSPINTGLGPTTQLQQVMIVPVSSSPSSDRYPANSNNLLLALGSLDVPSFGKCSAALFDGFTWYPYLLTSSANNTSGSIRGAFSTIPCCKFDANKKYLSVPAVILISIAISLGILFFCIALAFLFLFLKRRNHAKSYNDDPMNEWKPKYRPNSLLAMLDAANLNDLAVGSAATGAGAAMASSRNKESTTTGFTTALDATRGTQPGSMDITDNARLRNSSSLSSGVLPFNLMMANALRSNDNNEAASEDAPKIFYAKFPFEAKEFGELAFDAHTPIIVTDTTDNVWWMGYKDDGSNHPVSGLFPSNYVSKTKTSLS